ncbi:relaxase/mobilization nuclease domain-containing protein [Planococcus sp. ISL-110]|uniref:relaxase/mobilization nuclease domain-containing protein n=1 Tax=Planococcus sp. ISL-110 TaxID=2819167 RepID=UPI001BE91502|nr:relaxase/mobilization nuclease domain-containing protein [Planococcus sp. ISL-110]MBT2572078.1 relaxase/mobilization nuclease domain-containing protein [Planococcus sp. ISL-110]
MATIQLGNTKVATKLISYAEKRAKERGGVDCPAEYAKAQFKATRELWGKTEGIQAHHVIQSFKPGEVTAKMANEIGQDLARNIAKGHEAVVYTHTDKDHIHNHIVINAVSYENGSKYQSSKKDLYKIREQSDQLCLAKGLSIVKEPTAQIRYTLAEKALLEKGKDSWKDEIRESIDSIKGQATSLPDLAHQLKAQFGIETKITPKNISFKHPDFERFVRGTKLGLAYEKETLTHEFERQIERGQERGSASLSDAASAELERTGKTDEGNERTQHPDEKLHSGSHGQGRDQSTDTGQRTDQNHESQPGRARTDDFDFESAREHAARLRESASAALGDWQERDGSEQRNDRSENEQDRGHVGQQHEPAESQNERKHERPREKERDLGPER